MFTKASIGGIHLDAAGLVALADLDTIARRTSLIGSASFLDVLYLAPGIHCQQKASEINGGEYPMAGAMHNGYVFRIENPATVSYLQRIGKPGHLTTVAVSEELPMDWAGLIGELLRTEKLATLLFFIGLTANIVVIALLGSIRDWWALGVLGMLMLARLVNVVVIKLRQDKNGFKGAKESKQRCDLLVLLSQDRWVRMTGDVNDIKAVTAGQWLRESEKPESFAVSFGTLLVYGSAALAGNASTIGSLLTAVLLLVSVGVLGLVNAATKSLHMFNRRVTIAEKPKRYSRRLKMVAALLEEQAEERKKDGGSGDWDEDWAVNMNVWKRGQKPPLDDDDDASSKSDTSSLLKLLRRLFSGLPAPRPESPSESDIVHEKGLVASKAEVSAMQYEAPTLNEIAQASTHSLPASGLQA